MWRDATTPTIGKTLSLSAESGLLASLLSRAGDGDAEAFAELYDASAARVYGLSLRLLRNPAQAEEVTQEAYLEVWRKAKRFDPTRASAMSWILMITHSQAVNRVRSATSRDAREETYERQAVAGRPGGHDATFDEANAGLEANRVRSALAELTPTQRDAVQLAYFGGHTHREVAELTGVPLGTAKTRIRDGLLRLRHVLTPTAPITSD